MDVYSESESGLAVTGRLCHHVFKFFGIMIYSYKGCLFRVWVSGWVKEGPGRGEGDVVDSERKSRNRGGVPVRAGGGISRSLAPVVWGVTRLGGSPGNMSYPACPSHMSQTHLSFVKRIFACGEGLWEVVGGGGGGTLLQSGWANLCVGG